MPDKGRARSEVKTFIGTCVSSGMDYGYLIHKTYICHAYTCK